jgi:hypothetical protein
MWLNTGFVKQASIQHSSEQNLYADWRKNAQAEGQHLPDNHKVKQCKRSFTIEIPLKWLKGDIPLNLRFFLVLKI